MEEKVIVTAIVVATLIFSILGISTFLFAILYVRKKRLLLKKQLALQQEFNNELNSTRAVIEKQVYGDIGDQLHDNLCQELSEVSILLNVIEKKYQFAKPELYNSKEAISHALVSARNLAHAIKAINVNEINLIDILRKHVNRINKYQTLKASVEVIGEVVTTSSRINLFIYQACAEALQNCYKYAEATSISFTLNYLPTGLQLSIIDDGKGFDINLINKESQTGLESLNKKTQFLKGSCKVESKVGLGTTIILYLPYE